MRCCVAMKPAVDGRAPVSGSASVAAPAEPASARLTAWNTNWWIACESRKRTSPFAGWTLTSARERDAFERFFAMSVLGSLGFEKLAARRRVEVQVLDFDRGAGFVRGGFRIGKRAAFDRECPRVFFVARPAGQSQMGDCGDARQRFAAKTEARDAFEIVERGDFAGGMARDGQAQLRLADAAAVVADFEELGAAGRELHANVVRAGVEAVFEQFLQRGRRPLDNFSRGDLVDQKVGQHANGGHGKL